MKKFLLLTFTLGIISYAYAQEPQSSMSLGMLADSFNELQNTLYDLPFPLANASNLTKECSQGCSELNSHRMVPYENLSSDVRNACTALNLSSIYMTALQGNIAHKCGILAIHLTEGLALLASTRYASKVRNLVKKSLQDFRKDLQLTSGKNSAGLDDAQKSALYLSTNPEELISYLGCAKEVVQKVTYLTSLLTISHMNDELLSNLYRKFEIHTIRFDHQANISCACELLNPDRQAGLAAITAKVSTLGQYTEFPGVQQVDDMPLYVEYKRKHTFSIPDKETIKGFYTKVALAKKEALRTPTDDEATLYAKLAAAANHELELTADALAKVKEEIKEQWDKLVEARNVALLTSEEHETFFNTNTLQVLLTFHKSCLELSKCTVVETIKGVENALLQIAQQAETYLEENNAAGYQSLVEFMAGFLTQTASSISTATVPQRNKRQPIARESAPMLEPSPSASTSNVTPTVTRSPQNPTNHSIVRNSSTNAPASAPLSYTASSGTALTMHSPSPQFNGIRGEPKKNIPGTKPSRASSPSQEHSFFSPRNVCIMAGLGALSYYGYITYYAPSQKAAEEKSLEAVS